MHMLIERKQRVCRICTQYRVLLQQKVEMVDVWKMVRVGDVRCVLNVCWVCRDVERVVGCLGRNYNSCASWIKGPDCVGYVPMDVGVNVRVEQ